MPKKVEKFREGKPSEELVMQHTFHARDDIRAMDKRAAARKFLEVLPEDEEQAFDVYDSEADMEADRGRRQTGLLNEDGDAGGSGSESEEDGEPEEEFEEDDFEGPDDEDEDLLDGEAEEDEEYEEEVEEPRFGIRSLDDLPGDISVTVKVDGEEQQVTLDELRSGFSFQARNTKVAQKLAAERKDFEAEVARVRQERQRYVAGLAQLEEVLRGQMPEEPDWDRLEQENPTKFAAEHAKWERKKRQLEAVRREREQATMQAYEEHLQQEQQKLLEAIPEWRDPEKAAEEQKALAEFALNLGFAPEEVQTVDDHRVVLLLRDAMRYRRIASKGKDVVKGKRRKAKSSATLQPGGGTRRRASRKKSSRKAASDARRQLAETGSVAAATQLLLESDLLD